ncbi:hypothetical protein lerEdw1_011881 [Lerista edwardsae]|nr:hypothetical protein lerEdw1_011881 [Lerista edwardsae]
MLWQVAARTGESGVRRRTQAMSRSASKRRSRFSSLWGLDTTSKKKQGRPSINQVAKQVSYLGLPNRREFDTVVFGEGADSMKKSLEGIFDDTVQENKREKEVALTTVHPHSPDSDIWVHEYFTPSWYCLPNNQSALTVVHPGDTTRDVLEMICKAHQLDYSAHYLRLKFLTGNQIQFYVPKSEEDIYELLYKEIEICEKITQQIQIEKSDTLSENYGEPTYCGIHCSSRFTASLKAGDEILEINKKAAEDLNSAMLRDVLVQPSLCLTVRTYPETEAGQKLTQLPPRRMDGSLDLTDSPLRSISSSQGHSLCSEQDSCAETTPEEAEVHILESSDEADKTSKSTEQVAAFCRSLHEMNPSDSCVNPQEFTGPQQATTRQLTDADKLRKVICELLETERTYVKDLNCLMERYLKPLQKEIFLTQEELDVLFGNLTEMVAFQVEFLKTLEDGVRLVPDLEKLEKVDQFKKVLFSLGGSFLYYADRFKLYSAFCASHTKVPKVLVKGKS